MIYYYRSELYKKKIEFHNDSTKPENYEYSDSEYSGSDGSTCSSEDSSLEGRRRWRPTRFTNHGSALPKKYRSRWRDAV